MDARARLSTTSITRRRMLQLAGLGGVATACTDTSQVTSGGDAPVSAPASFDLPKPSRPLPSGPVKLRWMDSGDQKAVFFQAFFRAYEKRHDKVSVDYTGSNWEQIQRVITLGIRDGSEPDVFQLPQQITIPVAVANGWIGAFDDIVPDFAAVRRRYPAGVFVDGVTDFGGKSYAVPLVSGQRFNNLLTGNRELLERAGADLSQLRTWEEFRSLLKKLTKQGAGKYYGLVMGLAATSHLANPVSVLAEMAGLHGGLGQAASLAIDWRTGEFNYADPIAAEALEFFLAVYADGSLLPGSTSLDDAGARARMPQGVAGVMFDGPWDIGLWQADNPDFHVVVGAPPVADRQRVWPMTYAPGGNGKWVFKARSTARPVIGDIFSYLTTKAAQTQWARVSAAGDPPPILSAVEGVPLNPAQRAAVDIARRFMVLAPEPAARNRDVSKVYQQFVTPQPSFSDVCVGLLTGQLDGGVRPALRQLQSSYDRALDRAIAAVNRRGGKVSRADWVFRDWDPRRPYRM